ncbi:uncharacterized protein [Nicotiana sylvestris]|uniref:uncharacterized protein n=1 Tax=Nicotiana sylvestris TaxID=4096 RepID=UPI00388CBC41
MVTRVLVDNGSSVNICPLSTLSELKVDNDRIHKNSICVRGFDGNSVGDILLELTIGPIEFTMEFQVLDVAVSYNLLLGRPWIHAAKAVPSTLSFVKSGTRSRPLTAIPSSVTDPDNELIERFEKLFDSVNMVEIGEDQEEIIKALIEYKDIFAWSYDDMPDLSTDLVVHKLPTDRAFPHIKQKLRKFKTDMSVKIKEEITKQLDAKVIRVTRYPV